MRGWLLVTFFFLVGNAKADDHPKLLFIGDSHSSGVFGDTLDEELRENFDVVSYGVESSTPDWYRDGTTSPYGGWSRFAAGAETRMNHPKTSRLADLMARNKPDAVIIELGTNLVWNYPSTNSNKVIQAQDSKVKAQVQGLLDVAKSTGRPCIWIGPPKLGPHYAGKSDSDWRQTITMMDHVRVIEKTLVTGAGCTFIDSYPMTGYPDQGGDGIHYDRAGVEGTRTARSWAKSVKEKIDQALGGKSPSFPILKLTPPVNDSRNGTYELNSSTLEDRCGWTRDPKFAVTLSDSQTVSSCDGGRAHCQVSWTDAMGRKKTGYFFIGFSCRKDVISNQGYDHEDVSQMPWLRNSEAQCVASQSFDAEDLRIAGCIPTPGSRISADSSESQTLISPSGKSGSSGQPR
jgi:hypothetical protein